MMSPVRHACDRACRQRSASRSSDIEEELNMNAGNSAPRKVAVYDPTADEEKSQEQLAPRLATLDGKVVGLLDNTKDLVDTLLNEVQVQLQKDFPNAEFRYFRKDSVSGAPPGLMEQVAQCNAVVTAVGD
jgi:hypothetical protein